MIRLLLAAGIGTLVSWLGTRALIGVLTRNRIGQPIHEDVPEGHTIKAGTPTMGGLAVVAGGVSGYIVSDLWDGVFTWTGLVTMGAIAAAGLVGFLDDWLKISSERNLGLNKRAKTFGLLAVAVGFALGMLRLTNIHTSISFTQWDDLGWSIGRFGWSLWAILLILSASNAVNLTDGLDGLAAGSGGLVFTAYVFVGYWIFRHPAYEISVGLDLAVVAAAMMGACAGFLWWNAAPAKVFMGDTGALAVGGALAGIALMSNVHLLLPIIGGLYVVETLSVMAQIVAFRGFNRRVLRMAPIHHHFEVGGWPEFTVIVRFWLFAGICVALGLGIFYADFIRLPGVLD